MRLVFLIFIILFYSNLLFSQKSERKFLELNGYLKYLNNTFFIEELDSNFSSNLVHNRVNLKFNFTQNLNLRLEVRNRIFYGEQIKMIPNFGKIIDQNLNVLKLSHLWVNEESFVFHSVIDRMQIRYSLDKWDFKIGRQRINWGVNTIWNPNDIFNAYNFLDFDYEERPGTDAIRIQHYFKKSSFLDFAYKVSNKKEEQTVALLCGFNKWKYDFQMLSGIFFNDFVVGGGWAGSLKQIGFKVELSYFHPVIETDGKSSSFSISSMIDRTFKNDWYLSLGTLYVSKSSGLSLSNSSVFSSNLSARMLFPYRYNFYTTVMKSFSPILSLTMMAIYSTEKNTVILFPSFVWSVASNFDLTLNAQSIFSNQELNYRNLNTSINLRGRWSF